MLARGPSELVAEIFGDVEGDSLRETTDLFFGGKNWDRMWFHLLRYCKTTFW